MSQVFRKRLWREIVSKVIRVRIHVALLLLLVCNLKVFSYLIYLPTQF